VETQLPELALEVVDRVVREDDGRLLGHVLAEEGRVEMVAVRVGDVEVVRVGDRARVDVLVAREREPGAEVRRVEPRVAEDRARSGLHEQAGVAEEGDLHPGVPWSSRAAADAAAMLPAR
jgi:hypothetical protein